jgi:adenylate cyclase
MSTHPLPEGGHFGRFEINPAERQLRVDGQPMTLGSRAFDLLAALVSRRDRVVPKDELIDVVWPGLVVEENNLQVQISALRKVLGAQAIATVPGRGYRFTIAAVPAGASAPAPSVQRTAVANVRDGTPAMGASRLLVADDNKVNRLLLCRSLELMGHHVASADNGRSALQMLRNERFDLLLLDLEMPEIDGFALLEQRAADPALREMPVIVTSSLEGAAAVARCIELGADDYLHKPVNPMLLKARVDSSLERKHWRDRQRELVARLAPELPAGAAEGRRTQATLLAARLCAFDASPQDTLEVASNWSTLMLNAVEGNSGMVIQTTGDGITAMFDHADAAVQAALEMRELVALFNAEQSSAGRPAVVIGIGLASGEVVTGYSTTPRGATLVCIGAAVQRAGRLEALASEHGSAVLIDDATHAALAGRVAAQLLAISTLRGDARALPVYALTGL